MPAAGVVPTPFICVASTQRRQATRTWPRRSTRASEQTARTLVQIPTRRVGQMRQARRAESPPRRPPAVSSHALPGCALRWPPTARVYVAASASHVLRLDPQRLPRRPLHRPPRRRLPGWPLRVGTRYHEDVRIRCAKIGRNNPCPCGSGKKFKQCCLGREASKRARNDDLARTRGKGESDLQRYFGWTWTPTRRRRRLT
jgi:hypothetical protein